MSLMRRQFIATMVCLSFWAASGCSLQPRTQAVAPDYDPALLSGSAVFGQPVTSLAESVPQLLDADASMAAFVEQSIGDRKLRISRFRRLLADLRDQGYFRQSYIADVTQTAADTFVYKRGNCLSYTSMFVVLARMAGLDAQFQVVDLPPEWNAGANYLIRSKHVNAVVRGISPITERNLKAGGEYTVDFNEVRANTDYPSRRVSDAYASSLFFANIAVQHLLKDELQEGFRYLRASIETQPQHPDHWLNLGAFYATHRAHKQAQQAFTVALALEPRNKAANAGIARAYAQLGNTTDAQRHQKLARRYQQRNPYYHFGLAQRALHQQQDESALAAINRALRLNRGNGGFYYVKAVAQQRLGDVKGATRSLSRANRLGADPKLTQRYRHEFEVSYHGTAAPETGSQSGNAVQTPVANSFSANRAKRLAP